MLPGEELLVQRVQTRATKSTRSGASLFHGVSVAAALFLLSSCTTTRIKSTLPGPPTAEQIAELWVRPEPGRNLFHGVGGSRLAPDPAARYTVVEIKRSGYSRGYTVQ